MRQIDYDAIEKRFYRFHLYLWKIAQSEQLINSVRDFKEGYIDELVRLSVRLSETYLKKHSEKKDFYESADVRI